MRQSIGSDNRDQILKDVDSLSLEKYIEEIASAAVEGVGRCKTEKDIWSATEVCRCLLELSQWLNSGVAGYLCFP
jgi:regulator of nonsense transcripts 2